MASFDPALESLYSEVIEIQRDLKIQSRDRSDMKMTAKYVERYPMTIAEYREVEGFDAASPQPSAPLIQTLWQAFVNLLTANREPQIKQTHTPSGQVLWQVYDPASGNSATDLTEAEVRVWLEQRYQF